MSTADVPCEECEYQKRHGKPMLAAMAASARSNPALRDGDRVTLRTGLDVGKTATIVGRDGERVKVRLSSGTMLSVRPQDFELARRNPSGGGGVAGTLLLVLGTLTIVFGIILPVILNKTTTAPADR